MCGIFAFLNNHKINNDTFKNLTELSNKIKHRGPDMTSNILINDNKFFLGFNRLCVQDLSDDGMQPFKIDNCYSICNGEIYNVEKLRKKYDLKLHSDCDTEIIIPLVNKIGLKRACQEMDGVFSFIMINSDKEILVGRCPFGLRALYVGHEKGPGNSLYFSSEMKALPSDLIVKPFPPGCFAVYNLNKTETIERFYDCKYDNTIHMPYETFQKMIKTKLEDAVEKRLISDRPIGCLLSGGLDSSIIASILSNKFNKIGKTLSTFSVGLEGSEDIIAAEKVANYLGTNHHTVIVSEKEMLDAIPDDIYHIESYDITTVRASTPMFLLSKYISNNTNITVLFSGEGSDEASGSYMYFHNAPDKDSFKLETERLLSELYRYDVLRCDKSTAAFGLEVRVPFLDKDFIDFYMNVPTEYKMTNNDIEKKLLRLAFSNDLPNEIVWRTKEGMSDGVSTLKKPWYSIIQSYVETFYTDNDYLKYKQSINTPTNKESLHYREIFNNFFPNKESIIPHFWLPKWSGDTNEPSARILESFKRNKVNCNIENNNQSLKM